MARPIKSTPVLTGKDAENFIKRAKELEYKLEHPEEFPEFHKERKKTLNRQKKNYEIMRSIIKKAKDKGTI